MKLFALLTRIIYYRIEETGGKTAGTTDGGTENAAGTDITTGSFAGAVQENERKYQENIDLGRKEVSSAVLRQQAMERATGEKVELGVNPDVLSQAATELAQNYVFFKIPSALVNPKTRVGK